MNYFQRRITCFPLLVIFRLDVIIAGLHYQAANPDWNNNSFTSSFSLFSSNLLFKILDGKVRWILPDTAVLAHRSGI